jgi:iron complex transport system substrate-binding protein
MKTLLKMLCYGALSYLFACNAAPTSTSKSPKDTNTEASQVQEAPKNYKRIAVMGDEILEIVMSLGDSNKIVAIDKDYPEMYPNLERPKVGYKATFKTKYLIQHKVEAVFAEEDLIPEGIAAELEKLNIDLYRFEKGKDLEKAKRNIWDIAQTLQKEEQGKNILQKMSKNLSKIKKLLKSRKDSVKVLYVHARGLKVLLMSGNNTSTDGLIKLAGAKNAAADYEGMESLTEEDVENLHPDFLLMSQKSLDSFEGKMYMSPVLVKFAAYRLGRVIILDENKLLNFGANAGETAYQLCEKFYVPQYFEPLPVGPGLESIGTSTGGNAQKTTKTSSDIEIITPE